MVFHVLVPYHCICPRTPTLADLSGKEDLCEWSSASHVLDLWGSHVMELHDHLIKHRLKKKKKHIFNAFRWVVISRVILAL